MCKAMVFLGAKPGQTEGEFVEEYLDGHAKRLVAADSVRKLVENVMRQPTPEVLDAGWGWGGDEDTGILGIDEIWLDTLDDVLALYDGDNVIAAYEVDQYDAKTCLDLDQPVGTKSPWIKRMGLLRRAEGMRLQDFFGYWEHIHAPKALDIHIGSARYEQNRFISVLEDPGVEWNGSMSLYYWNVDSFRYGHFSRPGTREIIAADVATFQEKFLALPYGEEYIMKK